MKRLIRTIYAQSKKLDKDLFDFLQTCVDTFTYNTNAALLNECMSYMSNINIKDISEDNESEMYMYYMKIKSYAINNDLMDEFKNLKNQDAVDKELVSEGYTTDIIINEGTKVSGDQMVCTYKNDRLGDTYYIFEANDKFILKSSSDLNTDLLVTNNDDAGFNEIENLIIEHINNMPGYVRNTMGLAGIDVATEAWQEYLNNTTGANRDNSEQTSQTNNTKSNNSDNSQNTKIDDTTEYTVDIKFDSKDIAIINSFVNSANNSRYVVNTNFEQIKDASLKHRLVKRAFMADNIISSFKSYFPDMEFISAYFKDENKSDCCGLIAAVDNYFVALSYGCDADLDQFKTVFNEICSSEFSDIIDDDEKTVITAYYNENNITADLLKQYVEYQQDNQAFFRQKVEVEGMPMDSVARLIETMEELSTPESQAINYYSPEYQVAILNIFLDNAFYAEECDTFEAAEEYIFANNTVHSYTFYDSSYTPSESREELEQSPKYYLHVTFYRYYKNKFLTWLENHEKIILNYTDVETQIKTVPDSK